VAGLVWRPYTDRVRPQAFPLFVALSLGLPSLVVTGCRADGDGVDPTSAVQMPEQVTDFDAFVEGMNGLALLDEKDPRYSTLRTQLRDWVVPYMLERLDAGALDESEQALNVAVGMYRAAELREGLTDPQMADGARRLYRALAASGQETRATFALGVLHQFGTDEDRAWADSQFTELRAWVEDAGQYADEPGSYLDLETVLEEASAEFPSPWLHAQLEAVMLERYRQSRRGGLGIRQQQAEYTGYILARSLLRADDIEAARDVLSSLEGNAESDALQELLGKMTGKNSDLPLLIDLVAYFQPTGNAPLPQWVENQSWGIVENLSRRALAIDPNSVVAQLAMARSLRSRGLIGAAIAFQEGALASADKVKAGDEIFVAWAELAGLYQQRLDQLADTDDPDVARATLAELEAFHAKAKQRWPEQPIHPTLAVAYVSVASALYNTGHWEKARSLAQAAVDVEASAEALDLLGTIAFKDGDLELARSAYNGLFELAFEGAASRMGWEIGAHLELADIEAQAGDLRGARRHYKGALRHLNGLLSYPELDGAARGTRHAERGRVFFALGDLELAMTDFRSAISSAPNDPNAYVEGMMLFVSRGYLDQANEIFNRAISQDELGDKLKLYLSLWVRDTALRLGKDPDPKALEHIANYEADDWANKLARHARGELTIDQLLEHASEPGERAEAYFYEGMRRAITDGDAAGLAMMKQVRETGMMSYFEWEMARRFLVWQAIPRQARAPRTAARKMTLR
jgi:tetratricopeptide (TPR) repeat protein